MNNLRIDMISYVGQHKSSFLAEAQTGTYAMLVDMPDQAFEMADQIAGPAASLKDRMLAFVRVATQIVKMVEGGGDGELVSMLRATMAGKERPSRAGVQLVSLAHEIRTHELKGSSMSTPDPAQALADARQLYMSEHGLKGAVGIEKADSVLRITKPQLYAEYAKTLGGRS